MLKRNLIILNILLVVFVKPGFADYPIVAYRHLADPGALVYNGRVYLYCSNDDNNVSDDGYEMYSIVCVSSSDLKNWQDHGVVFQVPKDASWASNSWAPSPAEKNGKFYLYFGNGASGIGVATSDSPIGPFKDPLGRTLINSSTPGVLPADNMWLFDPMTFIDDDGEAYIYFGGNGENNLRVCKLNDDMISLDGAASQFHVPYFFEAAWMHKYNGTYYFSYSTNPSNGLRIDYMTSDNPITEFTYGGILSPQPPNNNNNNHQAVFQFYGEWYQAYHNRIVAQQEGIPTTYKRNLCVDKFTHNENGTINTLVNTVDGIVQVGNINPYLTIEAETINDQSGIETDINRNGGMKVTELENGDWIKVKGIDFGELGPAAFLVNVSSEIKIGKSSGGSIDIRMNNVNGSLLGSVPITYTGGEEDWKNEIIPINDVTGVHDIYFVFKGEGVEDLFSIDNWRFIEKTLQHDLIGINAYVEETKIDTITGYKQTKIKVISIYSDGTNEDVTSETSFLFDQENLISIEDSLIYAINYGNVTIKADYNGYLDSVKVLVKNMESEVRVSEISADQNEIKLFSGTSSLIKISAEFMDGHIEDVTDFVTYDNPNHEIATIYNGNVIAAYEGEVNIKINYQGQIGEPKSTMVHLVVDPGSSIWLEPELGDVGENWEIIENVEASNRKIVKVKYGLQSLNDPPENMEDFIVVPFTITSRGTYKLFARIDCAKLNGNSFWLKIDNGYYTQHSFSATNGWEWNKFREYVLVGGLHTLTIGYREDGGLIDKLVFSKYSSDPVGIGGKADNLIDPSGIEKYVEIPQHFSLEQNYPNPFNPTTTFKYKLPVKSNVTIKVYDILGKEIEKITEGIKQPGNYKVNFNGKNISSGVYYYRIEAGKYSDTKKFILLK